MGVQWTEEQMKVINTRNRNLLVSAAAGSGKTAVLVERIIQRLCDEENPTEIDQLLVVTFTNAAAAEMRERIAEALEKKLLEQPDNRRLHQQLALLPHASITTIHSFCLSILRDYFHLLDLDPAFRIADETELTLLRSDVLGEVLETHYQAKDEAFYDLVESYSSNKSDDQLEALILKVYTFSMSYPWPKRWLTEQAQKFTTITEENFEDTPWVKVLVNYLHQLGEGLLAQMKDLIEISQQDDGPSMYLDQLLPEYEQLQAIQKARTYEQLYEEFNQLSFDALSRKKSEQVDPDIRETVKNIRTEIKKTLEGLRDKYFYQPATEMRDHLECLGPIMETLVQIVIEFSQAYANAKEEKNIVDFNDLEHFALQLLVQVNEKQEPVPTAIAKELQQQYVEILIDEYQDSNMVQETLLNSVSRLHQGQPNLFMVGDVKQSIYKFRLAKPELFMEKYNAYSLEESLYQRIDLHKNFRSRKEVLDAVNFIFYQVMSKEVGEVTYDDRTALYEGARYMPCDEGPSGGATELHLIEVKSDEETDQALAELTDREIEAKMIAKRIKELMTPDSPHRVLDKKTGQYRPVQYRDMVILLRTMSGWADVFSEALIEEGIPAYSDASSGYFETVEVQTMMSLLRIIDNPRQDIPLMSVLRSPIVGINAEEMAKVRSAFPEGDYYGAISFYIESALSDDLTDRLQIFMTRLAQWREKVPYTPIQELMWTLYEETDYYDYVSVMPGGKQRQANLDMLIEKALQFEKSSYKGLFNFIRFIDKLKKYDIDLGEATILGENEDLVRIMSIHKSKGLEFPIVFVSGLGKAFNYQDLYQSVVIHPELGFGPDYVNYEERYKMPSIAKRAIQVQLEIESLSEELRVLYVALTRAKEKLILTGTISARTSLDKRLEKWTRVAKNDSVGLPFDSVIGAKNYLDWLVPSLIRHKGARILMDMAGKVHNTNHPLYNHQAMFRVEVFTLEDLMLKDAIERLEEEVLKEELVNWDQAAIYDEHIREEINRRLTWSYPYKDEVNVHVKMSVSEIKKHAIEEEVETPALFTLEPEELKPKFVQEESKLTAAERGTLMHKVMQYMSLEDFGSYDAIKTALEQLEDRGYINEKERKALFIKDLLGFGKSSLAKRMLQAHRLNKLFKEKQFVLGLKAWEMDESLKSDELVLVQGVIDCYFEEEDGLVLVDYKTDYVEDNKEDILVERYEKQLAYYQKALEQISGKKVKERLIYAFSIHKEIPC